MEINVRTDFKQITRGLNVAPGNIRKAARIAINHAADRVRKDSGQDILQAIDPKRGGKRQVTKQITTVRANGNNLTATVHYNEKGFGIEKSKKATIGRAGKSGRVKVTYRSKGINKAFRIKGDSRVFKKSQGKIKQLFTYTLLQEARKADVFNKGSRDAVDIAVAEFGRVLSVFD